MESLKIILLCIAAAITYGIAHDQITARICVEYFTIGHPPVFHTDSPTLLAFGWGVIATWWVGLPLGLLLALAARAGRLPKRSARSLLRPIAVLLAIMAICALLAGVTGFKLTQRGSIKLWEPLASNIAEEKHAYFLADGWAHSASYIVGFIGGLALVLIVALDRMHKPQRDEMT